MAFKTTNIVLTGVPEVLYTVSATQNVRSTVIKVVRIYCMRMKPLRRMTYPARSRAMICIEQRLTQKSVA